MKIGNLSLRPGLRFDSDDYMNKNTLAPRFSSNYDIFGNNTSNVTFGLNRYYGRSPFAYALNEGKDKLQSRWIRKDNTKYSEWIEDVAWNSKNQKSRYMFRELKIPYNDELALGFNQKFANLDLALKYVKRNAKDQVTLSRASKEGVSVDKNKYESDVKVYANNGRSKTDVYTLTLENINPYEAHGTKHKFQLGFKYQNQKTNHSTYNDELTSEDLDTTIKLDGKYIKLIDKPASDFNTNWTLSLFTISHFPQINMKWGNAFTLKNGHEYIQEVGMIKVPISFDINNF